MGNGEVRLYEVATPPGSVATRHSLFVSNELLPRTRRVDPAGTVWPSADIFSLALSADYTLTDNATAQKAFSSTAAPNGQITLPSSSAFLFECHYILTSTGTTSHTWSVLFAGTASLTALDFIARGRSGITSQLTLAATSEASQSNAAGALPSPALVVTAASVSATENVTLSLHGVVRINAGGTLIPQVKLSAVTSGVPKMMRGSHIRLTPIGADTATILGAWT